MRFAQIMAGEVADVPVPVHMPAPQEAPQTTDPWWPVREREVVPGGVPERERELVPAGR